MKSKLFSYFKNISSSKYIFLLYFVLNQSLTIIKGKSDTNKYKYMQFENGIRCIFVKSEVIYDSVCSLTLNSGWFNDTEIGIAHLIEHTITGGVTNYNGQNTFIKYLLENKGETNADVDGYRQRYYYRIKPEIFLESLSMFAEVFASPLFEEHVIERELDRINSEFEREKNMDLHRNSYIEKSFCFAPFSNFGCGNNATFFIDKDTKKRMPTPKIKEKISEWCNQNIFGDMFNIVIIHNEDINESQLEKYFSGIRKANTESRNIFPTALLSDFKPKLFKPEYTNKIICVKPLFDINELRILIEVPDQRILYKNNLLNFLIYFILLENDGYLLNLYKSRLLAKDIKAYLVVQASFTKLHIAIELLHKGMEDVQEVLNIFYDYINKFKCSKYDYELFQKEEHENFDFIEYTDTLDHAKDISDNMLLFPCENVLNFNYVYNEYSEKEVCYILDVLKKHENWMVLFISKTSFEMEKHYMKEPFYDIEYFIKQQISLDKPNIPSPSASNKIDFIEFSDGCKCFQRNLEKVYDEVENPEKIQEQQIQEPIIIDKEFGKFTFTSNHKIKCEESYIMIKLNFEVNMNNYIKTYFYTELLRQNILGRLDTYRFFKKTSYELDLSETGIEFIFSGKMDDLLLYIVEIFEIFRKNDKTMFEFVKILLTQKYQKMIETPSNRVLDVFKDSIINIKPKNDICLTEIKLLTKDDIQLKDGYFFEMFVCSNSAYEHFKCLFEFLYDKNLAPSKKFNFTYNDIEDEIQTCTTENLNEVGVFLQIKELPLIKSLALIKTIEYHCYNKFNELNAKSINAGYDLDCSNLFINNQAFLYFYVQKPKVAACDTIKNEIKNYI